MSKNKPHGMILEPKHVDYSTLTKFGTVTIAYLDSREQYGVDVRVEGFEFADGDSCRQNGARAMAWARDALNAALAADMLAPGGSISSSVD